MAKLTDFPKAINKPELAQDDWIAGPCGNSKHSDALTRANFDALLDRLDAADPNGDTWEILLFHHWKHKWLELIFVKPGSKTETICAESRTSLKEFPCLDDQLWLQYDEEDKLDKKVKCPSQSANK